MGFNKKNYVNLHAYHLVFVHYAKSNLKKIIKSCTFQPSAISHGVYHETL